MRPLLPCLCLIALAAGITAGEATTPVPLPQGPASGTGVPSAPPQLGITVDEASGMDGGGLVILRVTSGSTAAAMGLQAGDRVQVVNGRTIGKRDDLSQVMGAAKLGDAITIEVQRTVNGTAEKITARGTLSNPQPTDVQMATLTRKLNEMQRELDQLRSRPRKTLPETLQDLATTVRDLEDQLPTASEQFRKAYPNGRFKVSISIDIVSDAATGETVDVQPRPRAPGPATPATP
jgi:membrane-associated protease RseP (regulator of RpoE activity)